MNKSNTNGAARLLKKALQLREMSLVLIIAIMCVVLSFTNPFFATTSNLQTVLGSVAVDGILTIGMILVMLTGGLDLSIGSVMCMGMAIAGKGIQMGLPVVVALLLGILAAAVSGLLVGLIVTRLHLSHFIVTLCFMGIARGIVYAMTSGIAISLIAQMKENPVLSYLGSGYVGGLVPMCFVVFLILAIATDIYTRKSSVMRRVYYTGSNEMAAKHSGIKTDRIKVGVCVACSVMAGIASIIYMSKYNGVTVSAGEGAEMTALSAAVIGGVSMNGGKGTIAGGLLGLLFIVLIQDAMNLFSVQAFWQDLIRYLIVLLAVILDVLQDKARKKKNS